MKIKKKLSILIAITILPSLSIAASAAQFDDVPETYVYKTEIDYCKEKGFVKGVSDNMFSPDTNLTRGDFSVIWSRTLMFNDKSHSFTDLAPMNDYYDTASIIMYSLGVIKGTTPTTFSPMEGLTREQLAVITQRTFGLGEANPNDYMIYTDHSSISDWAQEGVNSCINADVFKGLYSGGENFNPQKPVTRAEICKLIYNINQPAYSITIGTLSGGTITASRSIAHPGSTINLTVTPDTGKQLKSGTLKYNDVTITGTSFEMPAEDVLITAEFEDKPAVTLESISVKSTPDKTTYTVDETLDLTGLVLEALYSDSTTQDITTGYTADPAEGTVLNTEGEQTITISYTEGEVTKTATFNVTVNAAS